MARSAASRSAALLAAVVFVVLNPYLFDSLDAWWSDLRDQAEVAADQPKPGQESGGVSYYLDSLTWGLGWAAALAALVGAVLELRRDLVRGLMLIAVPLALFVYLSAQSRYFGRWLLPAYPALAMLAAAAIGQAAELVAASDGIEGRPSWLGTRGGPIQDGRSDRWWSPPSPLLVLVSRSPPTSAAPRCSAATTPASRRATGSRRTIRPSCARRSSRPCRGAGSARTRRAIRPAGSPAARAATAGRSPAGHTWRRRRARLRAVQAGPGRAPRRRHPRLGLPRRARPGGDRRLPPLRLLPRHDGRRGRRTARSRPATATRAPTTTGSRASRASSRPSAPTTRAPTPSRSASTSPTTTTRPSTTGRGRPSGSTA